MSVFYANSLNPATGRAWSKRYGSRAEAFNELDARNEFALVASLFLSRFKWAGEETDYYSEYYFERLLFGYGVFGIAEINGVIMALPANVATINIYGEPATIQLYSPAAGFNGTGNFKEVPKDSQVSKTLPYDEVAIISDNPLYYPPRVVVERYTGRTADMERTEEVWVRNMKVPSFIYASADTSKTAKAIDQQVKDNEESIVVYGDAPEMGKVQPIARGYSGQELMRLAQYRKGKLNEVLSRLGIPAYGVQKSAQMSDAEISENNALTRSALWTAARCREEGVSQAKRKLGISLELEMSDVVKETLADTVGGEKAADNGNGSAAERGGGAERGNGSANAAGAAGRRGSAAK